MRTQLVAGNWKMNGSLASNQALLQALVPALAPLDRGPLRGMRSLSVPGSGPARAREARTSRWVRRMCASSTPAPIPGGCRRAMLADFGCRYVIVGHSERRSVFGETDEVVAAKFAAALKSLLTPILCVGETLSERESGVTEAVVARQLDAVVKQCGVAALGKCVRRLRAGMGDRNGQDRDAAAGAGGSCVHPRPDRRRRPQAGRRPAVALRRQREGRQRGGAFRDAGRRRRPDRRRIARRPMSSRPSAGRPWRGTR